MKPIHWFFTVLGILIIALFVGVALYAPPAGLEESAEVPMMSSELIAEAAANAARTGYLISWGVVLFAVILQGVAWVSALYRFSKVKNSGLPAEVQTEMLETIEVYFDLPLYFGLLGTVLAFVLITLFPDAGLMFAYVSTALGILISVLLRLSYLTPYRQELIRQRQEG